MQQQITMVKCDVVVSGLLAFSMAFLIKLCGRCRLQGLIGKNILRYSLCDLKGKYGAQS